MHIIVNEAEGLLKYDSTERFEAVEDGKLRDRVQTRPRPDGGRCMLASASGPVSYRRQCIVPRLCEAQ